LCRFFNSKTSYDSGLKSRTSSQSSVDSTSSSIKRSDSKTSRDTAEAVLPENANRMPRLSRTRSVLRFLETMIPALKGSTKCNEPENIVEGEEEDQEQKDLSVRRIYSHVFMLCETCQEESRKEKEKPLSRRKSSSKRVNLEQHGDKEIETERSVAERRRSSFDVGPFQDHSSLSEDSAYNDSDSDAGFGDRLYSMINEKWLSTVHEIMKEKRELDKTVEEDNDPKDESGLDYAGKNIDDDHEEYMDMNIIQDVVKAIQLQEAEAAKSASEGAETQQPHFTVRADLGFNSQYGSVLFEMNL